MESAAIPSTSTSTPVLFHPYHGENIELLEQRQRALRRVSFEKGLVFSDRPLKENEYFFISIENVEGGWSGHLRIGLTTIDPDRHPSARELESSSWLVSVSPFLVPLTSSYEPLPTEKGSLIGVYFERLSGNTRVHIVLNGFDMCPEVADIPSDLPLFAVVDVFGSTKEIRVVQQSGREPARLAAICTRHVNELLFSQRRMEMLARISCFKQFIENHRIRGLLEVGAEKGRDQSGEKQELSHQ